MLIYLHGCSGVGKTTIAKSLAKNLNNAQVIDQDDFYLANKPKILINGQLKSNWDCLEALDMIKFIETIQNSKADYIIVTGFALRNMPKPDLGILLNYNVDNVLDAIIKARAHKNHDLTMIKEVIYPFYLETLKQIYATHTVDVFNNGVRIDIDDITKKILKLF
jgi:deoxyadenosine/deoxycytidine kinase